MALLDLQGLEAPGGGHGGGGSTLTVATCDSQRLRPLVEDQVDRPDV
jgi:hypothetical protein